MAAAAAFSATWALARALSLAALAALYFGMAFSFMAFALASVR